MRVHAIGAETSDHSFVDNQLYFENNAGVDILDTYSLSPGDDK